MSHDGQKRPVNRKVKFTERKIQELLSKPPQKGESAIEWTDISEDNLKLCVYPSGKAAWRQRGVLNGKKVFITIAPVNVMNLATVRDEIRKNKALLLQGINPKEQVKVESSPTIAAFIEGDFLPFARKKYKSIKDVQSRLSGKIIPQFGHYRLTDIRKADIVRYHEQLQDEISSITANRTLSLLSSVLKRAVDLELIDKNPASGVKKFYEGESRDRFLSDIELKKFFAALRKRLHTPQGQAIFLLISLGLRRSELLGCKWVNVDLDARQIYIPDPKNRKPRYVAINSQAHGLLLKMYEERTSSAFLFPSGSAKGHLLEIRRSFSRTVKEAGIDNLRGHDLRRTNASLLINGGASLAEVKEALGHQDIRSTLVYARLSTASMAKTGEIAARKIEEAMDYGINEVGC
jgi:integrase